MRAGHGPRARGRGLPAPRQGEIQLTTALLFLLDYYITVHYTYPKSLTNVQARVLVTVTVTIERFNNKCIVLLSLTHVKLQQS